MELAPYENHWWNVTLRVTPRGLRTPPIPYGSETFDVQFDFIAHQLLIQTSNDRERIVPLFPRSVADFYAEYVAALRSLAIELNISPIPVEFDDKTPFDRDHHHASYDRKYVESFRQILVHVDQLFKKFRGGFLGKCSPVQFFWGSFDLAVTRFSGRRAPLPANVDSMTREAYSHEVISCGFWPGDRRFKEPAFYSYTIPTPAGLDQQTVSPAAAYWDKQLGEFILKYADVGGGGQPEQAILDFCQSTYDSGATLAHWDRDLLHPTPTTSHPNP